MSATLQRASALLDDFVHVNACPDEDQPPATTGRTLPVGIYRRGPSRLEIQLSINGRPRYLGSAPTVEEAAKIVEAVRKVAPRKCRVVLKSEGR